jgi:hypothetical protein
MEMSSSDHRNWNGRHACDGRGEERGQTPEDRDARAPDCSGHRGAERPSGRNERDLARDVLVDCRDTLLQAFTDGGSVARNLVYTYARGE